MKFEKKFYQVVLHAEVDGLPDHGESGDSVDVLQDHARSFGDVIVNPEIRFSD
jgi:hypothetical protein